MSAPERPGPPGPIAGIRQVRSAFPAAATESEGADSEGNAAAGQPLEARMKHLEQLVEGLQDAMYRESQRQEKRIEELEARLDPAELSVALSKDARKRGL
jgi:hypothetical protein